MRFKILGLLAGVALLAACSECEDETVITSGQGEGGLMAAYDAPVSSSAAEQVNPGSSADFLASTGDRVHFGLDKAGLSPEMQETLKHQAEWLRKNSTATVTIEGHCDPRGTSSYNLGLGQRRANAARDYLVSLGVSSSRIKVISYGKERPVVSGNTEEYWAENRVAITVID